VIGTVIPEELTTPAPLFNVNPHAGMCPRTVRYEWQLSGGNYGIMKCGSVPGADGRGRPPIRMFGTKEGA
jgi:hypothetical protein